MKLTTINTQLVFWLIAEHNQFLLDSVAESTDLKSLPRSKLTMDSQKSLRSHPI